MEDNNITRTHIALEAMKILLARSVEVKRKRFKDDDDWFLPDPEELAQTAYEYADAMIAERERTKDRV